MRIVVSCFAILAIGVLGAGCAVPSGEPGEEPISETASRQVPPDLRYAITQSGVLVASEWGGTTSTGTAVEYWAAKPGYSAGAARTLTATSSTCADWKADVCSSSWAGSTYYRATYVETSLDCSSPPAACRAPRSAVSFLAPGSYQVQSGAAGPYAWTYVSGACEHWSMSYLCRRRGPRSTTRPSPTSAPRAPADRLGRGAAARFAARCVC